MWVKKGLIFKITNKKKWMKTYTTLPFADRIKNNIFRIYFSPRDSKNKSSTAYIEVDITNPNKLLFLTSRPIITPGKLGSFDENGVMASSLVNYNKKKYLYYTGWSSTKTTSHNWSIGLAISNDRGKTFQKYSEGPVFTRNPNDPYFVASPTVIYENKIWKMWYVSTIGWIRHKNRLIAPYHIKYAESEDGIHWNPSGKICINLEPKEKAVGRASLIKENGLYKMWYSYYKEYYRIGYAESKNGFDWKRKDGLAGINISNSGWDSRSIEYPFVFENKGVKIMLYNGNNYGKTGFGYAIFKN